MALDLDHPARLLRLAQDEARAIAAELVRTNPDGLARGEQLTGEQYQFLLRQVMDRLRKSNQLPVRPLTGERLGAFEQPFWEVLHNSGLI